MQAYPPDALARPVFVLALDASATTIVTRLARNFPGPLDRLTFGTLDLAAATPAVPGLAPGALQDAVLHRLAEGQLSWLVVARLSGNVIDARDDVFEAAAAATLDHIRAIVDYVVRLSNEEFPLTLTLILVDPSLTYTSATRPLLDDLARVLLDRKVADKARVYLLRRRRIGVGPNHLKIDDRVNELDTYAELACRALILANGPGVLIERNNALLATGATDANVASPAVAPIFGRLVVQHVRSLLGERAAWCAGKRLADFARQYLAPNAAIEPAMLPPVAALQRPAAFTQVADRDTPLTAPVPEFREPTFRSDAERQFRRIKAASDVWLAELQHWRPTVRVQFDEELQGLRRQSASERRRGCAQLDDQITTLWANPAVAGPVAAINTFLDRQHGHWDADRGSESARVARSGGGRTVAEAQLRRDINQDLDHLEAEMSRRPNFRLLAISAVLVFLASAAILGALIDRLRDLAAVLPPLDPDLAARATLLKIVGVLILTIAVLLAGGGSLYRARLRWNRAFDALRRRALAVCDAETASLATELDLVDTHWYVKTLAACQRHIAHQKTRLEAALRPVRRGTTVEPRGGNDPFFAADQRHPLVRSIPEADTAQARVSGTREDALAAVEVDEVARLLRTADQARGWLAVDSLGWSGTAHDMIADAFLAAWGSPAPQASLAALLANWPNLAGTFLVAETQLGGRAPALQDHIFVGGKLTNSTRDALATHQGPGLGRTLVVASPLLAEELLLCRAQTGLDAATVA